MEADKHGAESSFAQSYLRYSVMYQSSLTMGTTVLEQMHEGPLFSPGVLWGLSQLTSSVPELT